MGKEFYIRYRIYVQKAIHSDRTYPRRLIGSINNLRRAIGSDYKYWQRHYKEEEIKSKAFTPEMLNHVGPKYYYLISYISQYFNCVAVWDKKMIKGSTKPINSFQVFGYEQDMLLAFHYISKIINNLDAMRWNMKNEFKRTKINRRRRGKNIREKETALTKSSKFFYRSLDNITSAWKEILDNKPISPNNIGITKQQEIYKHLLNIRFLNFRKYNYTSEPRIWNAQCREGKFQNRRIILAKL